jgi:hypothetical protein
MGVKDGEVRGLNIRQPRHEREHAFELLGQRHLQPKNDVRRKGENEDLNDQADHFNCHPSFQLHLLVFSWTALQSAYQVSLCLIISVQPRLRTIVSDCNDEDTGDGPQRDKDCEGIRSKNVFLRLGKAIGQEHCRSFRSPECEDVQQVRSIKSLADVNTSKCPGRPPDLRDRDIVAVTDDVFGLT